MFHLIELIYDNTIFIAVYMFRMRYGNIKNKEDTISFCFHQIFVMVIVLRLKYRFFGI